MVSSWSKKYRYAIPSHLQPTRLVSRINVSLIMGVQVPAWHGSTVPDGDVRADSITAATPSTVFIVDEHAAAPAHADPLR